MSFAFWPYFFYKQKPHVKESFLCFLLFGNIKKIKNDEIKLSLNFSYLKISSHRAVNESNRS